MAQRVLDDEHIDSRHAPTALGAFYINASIEVRRVYMEYAKWKTITGMTIDNLRAALDKELPADAYKEIPGQAYLTDINSGYMKKCLNDVFGICGLGWGYKYSPEDLLFQNATNDGWTAVLLRTGTFWFKMVADDYEQHTITITASGGSENNLPQYALKGAITNMISNAVSQIGFQESVYMGKRSHNTTGGNRSQDNVEDPSEKQPAQAAANASALAQQASKGTPANVKLVPPSTASPPYLVPSGVGIAAKHQGSVLADMSDAALQFYAAGKFAPMDDTGKELRRKCLQEVKTRTKTTA
jgi:hypothetical protein